MEAAFIHDVLTQCGWSENKRNGFWYRHPADDYTIQVIENKWEPGIYAVGTSKRAPMVWHTMKFRSIPAAVKFGLKTVGDTVKWKLMCAIARRTADKLQEENDREEG